MGTNLTSVSHTIRAEGFKYDILKGELSNGSYISKFEHPIHEVEEFKKKLFARNMLKDTGSCWTLRKNIRTGLMMAVNLHFGQLLTESPFKQDIIVTSDEAAKLKGKLPEKHICVTDSEIVMKSLCDTLKITAIHTMNVNEHIFNHHGSDTFGQDEAFVLKILKERGIVSSTSRHGYPNEKEADIVDELNKEQYEIIYEFKTALSKKRMKENIFYSPEMLTLQLVDSPFIHTSKSLEKKLKKEYTDRYRANLVILTLGSRQSTIGMLEALSEKLKTDPHEKFNYCKVFIISLDFINEQALFVRISPSEPFLCETFPCKNDELGFIKLTPIKFDAIKDSEKYLIICNEIFNESQRLRYDNGKALKDWAKEIHIWSID